MSRSSDTRPTVAKDSVPEALVFDPLYYRDRLRIVNPRGDVGVITLWSPVATVERKLRATDAGFLDRDGSRIAVIANLYGDGMFAMFCNLLWNPQVRHLVAVGQDLGLPTTTEIEAFISDGLEPATMLGQDFLRVRGTGRLLPAARAFDAEALRQRLSFVMLGKLSRPRLADDLQRLLTDLPRVADASPRIRVEIPPPLPDDYAYRPSLRSGHQVVRAHPLDCWRELVTRVIRFGEPVPIGSGTRLELLNVKAIVTEPTPDSRVALISAGFDPRALSRYQSEILDPDLPEDQPYSYGNRLLGHFPQAPNSRDTLESVAARLRADPTTRRAYISLWDTAQDLPPAQRESPPCLTTLWFRIADGVLALTATYRSHNLLDGWLMNVYGLMAIQRRVSRLVRIEPGALTVISHSLGINPESVRYDLAKQIASAWKTDDDLDNNTGKYSLREDPNGYFVVSTDPARRAIVAEHRFQGVLIKRYEAKRAATIEHEVAADMAVSLVSHAMWLGRELARHEQQLRAHA